MDGAGEVSVTCYANPGCITPPVVITHSPVVHHFTNVVPHLVTAGGLPYTGADVVKLFILGSALVLLGAMTLAGRSGRKAREVQ